MKKLTTILAMVLLIPLSAATTVFPSPFPSSCTIGLDRLIVAPGGGSGGQLHYAAQWMTNVNGTPESTRITTQWDVAGQTGGMLIAIKSTTDSGTPGWIYGVNFTWSGGVTNNRAYPLTVSWANQTVQFGPEINGLPGTPPTISSIVFTGNASKTFANDGVAVIIQERVNVLDSFEIKVGDPCSAYGGSGRYKSGSASDTNLTTRCYCVVSSFPLNTTVQGTPTVPLNLTVTPGAFENLLEWDPPANNGSGPVLGYNIYRQDNITMTPVLLTSVNATSYVDRPLPCASTAYNYSIAAFNAEGEGDATAWSGFFVPLCRTGTLFGGENSQIYGPGGRAGLAAALGIPEVAAGFFWGMLIIIALTILGGILGTLIGFTLAGALTGAVVGLALTTLWEMIPWWATLFVVVFAAASFILLYTLRSPSQEA